MGRDDSAQTDAHPNTFGEGPEGAEEAQTRFRELAGQRFEELRADLERSGELNSALAKVAGLNVSGIPPELLGELEELVRRESQAEPPPLRED